MSASLIVSPERIPFSDIPSWLKRGAIVIVGGELSGSIGAGGAAGGIGAVGTGDDGGSIDAAAAFLSAAERERMSRLHSAADAERYFQQRLLLRAILSHCTAVAASAIEYRWNRHGKPSLRTDGAATASAKKRGQRRLRFSVTHSGAQLLIAMSSRCEVGIDCEEYRRRRTSNATARFILSRRGARRASFSHRAFIRQWVLREAIVKCVGQSLYNARAWMAIPRCIYRLALSPHFAAACVAHGVKSRQVYYCHLEHDALAQVMRATQGANSTAVQR